MQLQEHHKQFVVRRYARFMDRDDIVDDFINNFREDIEELCGKPYETEEEFIDRYKRSKEVQHVSYSKRIEESEEMFSVIAGVINYHIERLLTNRFRRLDINHPQFPEKYRDLFNATRDAHLNMDDVIDLQDTQNIVMELEMLYNIVKTTIYKDDDITLIPLAHQLLKSILTINLCTIQEQVSAITTSEETHIPNTQIALIDLPENQNLGNPHDHG